MPAGAIRPSQAPMSKPGKPCSATVGTSGSIATRSGVLTASAFSRPDCTLASDDTMGSKVAVVRPPTMSVCAWLLPLYGTCTMAAPALDSSTAVTRWLVVPMPVVA
ncbi:hypothetical protein G6F60_015135 [Rhizopus arrhizus]|nr:hypothetical protein G6F60_015135 [Rhizopus arrhizus]